MDILNLKYEKYKLDNGLEVILHQNRALPLVAVNVWYKVGSSSEVEGKTGIAHLFEHMMFQGSENVPKEMHFRNIQEAGGTLNGSTSVDRTNYFEKLPANYLELALWLESDRMGFFLPALTQEKLDNQKDVVKNERLERYDNQPYGLAWELILTNLYPEGHPYSWATIGFLHDIKGYTLHDVKSFFNRYYSPNNASLVVAGDFESDEAKLLIEKYFSGISSGSNNTQQDVPLFKLKKNKILTHPDNVQLERLYLAWPTVKVFDDSDASLDVLSDLLAGSKNSRLYKSLVFEKEIAQDVSAFQFSGKYGGHFNIIATAKPGNSIDDLKLEIFRELDLLINKGLNKNELIRSKNGIKSGFVFSLQNLEHLADQMNAYNFYIDEPNSFAFDLNRYNSVTENSIINAVENHLKYPFVELRVIPESKIK